LDRALEPVMLAEGLRVDRARDVVVPPVFDPVLGDHGLSALRTRAVSRASARGGETLAAYRVLGAGVLGPVFTGFAEWVVRDASPLGARRVYCLMREGAFLAPLIERIARSLDVALEARPLWVSRQVAARAALLEVDDSTLRALLARRTAPTVRSLAATLG